MRSDMIYGSTCAAIPALVLALLGACSSKSESDGSNSSSTKSTQIDSRSADYSALAANADEVAAGKKLFGTCAVCHSVEAGAPSPAGPNLAGVLGRPVAGAAAFPYSQALKTAHGAWAPENLDAFLKNPQAAYPGNAMAYAGMVKDIDRKAIIAFLASRPAR